MGQMETGIITRLLAVSGISSLVGTRVRPLVAGQADSRPFLLYQVTTRETIDFLGGEIATYSNAEFEIAIYADDYTGVMDLSDLVRTALDQYGGTVANVEFAPCRFVGETDTEQTNFEGQESPGYCRVLTFKALFRITG